MRRWRLMFLTGSIRFPATIVTSVQGLYPRCAGQIHSLEKDTLALLVNRMNKKMLKMCLTVKHVEK
jgi:hypothetical protein